MTDPNSIYLRVNGKRMSLAKFLEMAPDAAKTVDASGCTALTELRADAAEYVYASGCTALTEPLHFDAGYDSREFAFSAIKLRGKWRIIAGCRNFTVQDAQQHWGRGGPSDRPDCLALVEKLAAQIAAAER